jgi:hypothetical protein
MKMMASIKMEKVVPVEIPDELLNQFFNAENKLDALRISCKISDEVSLTVGEEWEVHALWSQEGEPETYIAL